MPVEYETVQGGVGLEYVLTHDPEQWEMLFFGEWFTYHWWKCRHVMLTDIVRLKFRRQVSSEFSL